jgi:hypothetical protein
LVHFSLIYKFPRAIRFAKRGRNLTRLHEAPFRFRFELRANRAPAPRVDFGFVSFRLTPGFAKKGFAFCFVLRANPIGAQAFNYVYLQTNAPPVSQPACRSSPGPSRGRLVEAGCLGDYCLVLRVMMQVKIITGSASAQKFVLRRLSS